MQVGYRQKSRFSSNSWLSKIPGRAKCNNIYRRRSWVYDTIGHAPLAIDRLLDVRTTKWQKQLPTTMQCRSHSRRLTSKCLFVTACSIDEYAEEKRTEKNIVPIGISDCARRFIQTRSIALWQAELTFIRFFSRYPKKLCWISEKEFVISEILAH